MRGGPQILIAVLATLVTSGCGGSPEEPVPGSTATARPTVSAAPVPTQSATPQAPVPPPLDMAALSERRDPDRVLRFYAAALHQRAWKAAANAWGEGSGVTAGTLKAAYDREDAPTLEVGEGQLEGAAGSSYYRAPVTLRFGDAGGLQTGSLILRRVNDVPGATAEQLRWHIEKSEIGVAPY